MAVYSDMFMKLSYEVGIITFMKKSGTPRVMMCTRNLDTSALFHGNMGGLLGGYDKRCSIRNGNIAVVDLLIGECRSFSVSRVINEQYFGEIYNKDKLNEVAVKAMQIDKVVKDGMQRLSNLNPLDQLDHSNISNTDILITDKPIIPDTSNIHNNLNKGNKPGTVPTLDTLDTL